MKYCIDKYPLGSLPNQKTAGRYMDGYLHENIKILAKKIVDDMTFLGVIFSSTLEVGTGKSTFAQQIAEAYVEEVNKQHNLNLELTTENIVFRPKDLIEKSFKLPKYAPIILDEWEDMHYFSELGIALRTYLRKCRQLNQFIIIIIPNFFQLQTGYAINRSAFAIDVKFMNEFERGFFSFYNFKRKKQLYLKGKKYYDYAVVQPNFSGRFLNGYAVDEKVYRKAKYDDMLKEEEASKKKTISKESKLEITQQLFRQLRKNMPKITMNEWAIGFSVSDRTLRNWNNKGEEGIQGGGG
jgi:DNA-binding transcriptional regulator YiaG